MADYDYDEEDEKPIASAQNMCEFLAWLDDHYYSHHEKEGIWVDRQMELEYTRKDVVKEFVRSWKLN